MMGSIRGRAGVLAAIAFAITATALSGCATYTARQSALVGRLAAGDYDAALATVEKNRRGKDLLLYWLEKGLILHYADRWQESNAAFEAAEQLAADLYTKSISEAALSLIANDNTISYRAPAFEMAMIPYYRVLNYVYLGDREDAVVEARKASLYLSQYADRDLAALADTTARDAAERASAKDAVALLADDAFLHYFSGLVYEWGGEVNDAFIEYRGAAVAYRTAGARLQLVTPPWLGEDLERTGRELGFSDALAELRRNCPAVMAGAASADSAAAARDDPGGVVLLLELGSVPQMRQVELNVPILKTDHYADHERWAHDAWRRMRPGWRADEAKLDYWLRVAVPTMSGNRPVIAGARVSAGTAGGNALAVPVEDLEGRALLTFEAREPGIMIKSIARALAKYGATKQARKKGELAGILANALGAALESADTRGWITLPNAIAMARLSLPPGHHALRVDLTDREGRTVETRTIEDVIVRSHETAFVSRRVF
jgi:hypothetical protein